LPKVDVGLLHDLPEGRGVAIAIGPHRIALFRFADEVLAVENRCPHRGFPLHDGTVDEGRVRCRTHGSVFDLRTGACHRGPASRHIGVYRTEVVAGVVHLDLPD
jgi:nitrite reductase/ring-hydroxylating ferredoxin subunit